MGLPEHAATPFLGMVLATTSQVGLIIISKSALATGMSSYAFVAYSNALAAIILLPLSLLVHRSSNRPPLTFLIVCGFFSLGVLGCLAQLTGYTGISYTSAEFASAMLNLIPEFDTRSISTIKFDWKNLGSQARLLGTLISFAGAISVTLYKGPTIRNHSSPSLSSPATAAAAPLRFLVFSSPHQENWVLGCILFAASSFTLSIWNIVQVGTVKMCPQVMKIISFYSLFGTIQSAIVGLFLERHSSAWRLELNFDLLVIVLTAIFSTLFRTNILIWCTKWKGPYFVPAFKPFGIPYASTFGCLLFADTFHFGSMIGAFVCGVGYYTVLWGEIKDGETQKLDHGKINDPSMLDHKVPLLQDKDDCEV